MSKLTSKLIALSFCVNYYNLYKLKFYIYFQLFLNYKFMLAIKISTLYSSNVIPLTNYIKFIFRQISIDKA